MRAVDRILVVDAIINLALGFLLLIFGEPVIRLLGVPGAELTFYPNILGGVLFGIGIALLIESFRGPNGLVGLGLGGAIAINLSGGLVLMAWLIFGGLNLAARGQVFLWLLAVALVLISAVELLVHLRKGVGDERGV